MSIKIKKGILAVIIFLTAFIYSEDVYAVDYETALQIQQIANENYYAVLNQQQAAANMAQAALKAQQNAAQASSVHLIRSFRWASGSHQMALSLWLSTTLALPPI